MSHIIGGLIMGTIIALAMFIFSKQEREDVYGAISLVGWWMLGWCLTSIFYAIK